MSKRKRVYVVRDEHETILGVFSTYEKANDSIDKEIESLDDFYICGFISGKLPHEIENFKREIIEYELDNFAFSPDHDGWFNARNPGKVINTVEAEWCDKGRVVYDPVFGRCYKDEEGLLEPL